MSDRPKKTTREALLDRIRSDSRGRRRKHDLSLEEVVDRTLEAVDAYARPHLENDWTGGEVLHQIRLWRKGRL